MTQSVLVDSGGRPLQERSEEPCPECGAAAKEQETVKGFGGYWSRLCKRCGRQVAGGREEG